MSFGLRALAEAIVSGDVDTLRAHLAGGGSPDLGDRGTTLLMEATNFKQLEIARMLVEAGADVGARRDDSQDALAFALQYPRSGRVPEAPSIVLQLTELLLDAGAEVNPSTHDGATALVGLMFDPPLHRAAKLGDPALIQLLLSRGAKVEATGYLGGTALVDAVNGGHARAVETLLVAGAAVEPECPKRGGHPLHRAVLTPGDKLETVRYKARKARRRPRASVLQSLETEGLAIVDLLIEAGAELERPDHGGQFPLRAAINYGWEAAMERLVAAGAGLEQVDSLGTPALHAAAGLNRLEEPALLPVVQALLRLGADPSGLDPAGDTAAAIASRRGFRRLARSLG